MVIGSEEERLRRICSSYGVGSVENRNWAEGMSTSVRAGLQACGPRARADQIELELRAAAPVGAFLDVEAHLVEVTDEACRAVASASVEEQPVASARARYYRR